jgi:ABC-type nitrate/sulfonate/bicarbonate transport system substrate-binding protein
VNHSRKRAQYAGPTRLRVRGRSSRLLSAGMVGALVVTGLSPAMASAATSTSKLSAPPTVNVAVVNTPSNVAWWVLAGNGKLNAIDKKFHTNIVVNDQFTAADATSAFASGQFQIFTGGLNYPVQLRIAGVKSVGLLGSLAGGGVYLVGATKYEKTRGTHLNQWSGAKWAISATGSLTQIWLNSLMSKAGVSPSKISETVIPLTAQPSTLAAGQIQAFAGDPGAAAQAISSGDGYLIANSNSPAAQSLFGGVVPAVSTIASPAFINKYPALSQAIVTALMGTLVQMENDVTKPQVLRQMLPLNNPYRANPTEWAALWKLLAPAITSEIGLYTKSQLQATTNLFLASGALTPGQSLYPGIVTNKFGIVAYKSLHLKVPAGLAT